MLENLTWARILKQKLLESISFMTSSCHKVYQWYWEMIARDGISKKLLISKVKTRQCLNISWENLGTKVLWPSPNYQKVLERNSSKELINQRPTRGLIKNTTAFEALTTSNIYISSKTYHWLLTEVLCRCWKTWKYGWMLRIISCSPIVFSVICIGQGIDYSPSGLILGEYP
jgi:hypothetical protein